jgi:phosphate-selective porin OprO/OprP
MNWNGSLVKLLFIMGSVLLVMMWMDFAVAQEKNVSEEILDILKEQGQITDQQYEDLKKKAEAEKKETESQGSDFKAYWNNGIRLDSKDGNFKLKLGGRIQIDWAAIEPDSDLERSFPGLEGTGAEFRRARIYFSGTIYDSVDFKAQYDFAGGDADFKDVWLGLRKVPGIGHLRVGHMKEPFSLEELTSSKYITFMERALPVVAFAPGRNTGIMAQNPILDKRMTWAAGVFQDVGDFGDSFNDFDDYNITLRLTGLPWYEEGGRKLLHTGFSYTHKFRSENDTTVRFRSRPESHITDERLVDTGTIGADNVDLINPEAALVYGPFSLQGEYFYTKVDSGVANDPEFQGFYSYASYFFTGEHRIFKTSSASFDRVKPKKNFHPTSGKGGPGAWELGVRWSYIDLNDKNVQGGKESNITAGLNWYLNPNVRTMLNYIYADLKDRAGKEDGTSNIFQMRFQIDF